MIVLMMLVFIWMSYVMPYVMKRLLPTAQQARTPTRDGSQLAPAEPSRAAGSDTGGQDGQGWTALDDRQLTRLLTDYAPRTITE
ncbi:MAG: hypothetical protein ABJD68_19335 [Nakamurella sp.]